MGHLNNRAHGERALEPYVKAVPVDVSSADQPLTVASRAIYFGGASAADIAVEMVEEKGVSRTFKRVPPGTTLRIAASKILKTGTTATDVLVLI